jgi:hypothetical protein
MARMIFTVFEHRKRRRRWIKIDCMERKGRGEFGYFASFFGEAML